MMSYLTNVTSQDVASFETSLINSKSLRHQRSALLELVRVNKNQNSIENGDEMSKRKKQLEEAIKNKKKSTSIDVMNDPYTENGALGNLFGEE